MMQRLFKLLVMITMLVLLLPYSVFAAPQEGASGTYIVSGHVTIGDPAEGLKGVKISFGKYSVVTGKQGEFSLRLPSNSSGDLLPVLAGYRFTPAKLTLSSLNANQDNQNFTAIRLVKMSGRVLVQGKPVKDVTVSAGYTDSSLPLSQTKTDAKGNYSLWVEKSELTPTAAHGYFHFADAAKVTPTDDFKQDWKEASVIVTGTILEDGLPAGNMIMRVGSLAAATDASGKYSFTLNPADVPNLAAQQVAPEPLAGFHFTPKFRPLNPGTSASGADFIAVRNPWPVSGKVVLNGKPLAGVLISDGKNAALTNAKGLYTLEGVPFGRDVSLTAFKYGYSFAALNVFSMPDNAVKGKDFTGMKLETPRKLGGKVTAAGGGGLKDVTVILNWNGKEFRRVKTDKTGAFLFTGLLADAGHTLEFSHTNYQFLPIGAQAKDLTAADATDLKISGTRVAPLSGVLLGIKEGTSVKYSLNGSSGSLTVSKGSKYSIPDLKTGLYTLAFTLDGYQFKPENFAFEIKENTTKVVKNFTAVRVFTVSGHIYDKEEGTTGLEGALVKLAGQEVKTGPGGAFTFKNVPIGKQKIVVTLKGKTFPTKDIILKDAGLEDVVVKAR